MEESVQTYRPGIRIKFFLLLVYFFFYEDMYKNREKNAAEKNSTVTSSITELFSPDALFPKVIDPYNYSVHLYLNKIKT